MYWEKRWFQFIILLILAFIWGSSFILIKVGLKSFGNNQAAAIRLSIASLVLLPLSLKNLRLIRRKDLKSLLIAGFIGSFFPAFLFTKAQTQIDSALAGILNSLTPVFTLLIGLLVHHIAIRGRQTVGVALGLFGAVGLVITQQDISDIRVNHYALYIILATVFYGTSINEIKAHLTHLSGVQITSLSFLFIGPAAWLYLLTTDFSSVTSNPDWPFHLLALAVLAIIGTAFAMLLMNSLIRYTSPVFASSVTYIIPLFAIMWGILDRENITYRHVLFMITILFGVYLISKRRNTGREPLSKPATAH